VHTTLSSDTATTATIAGIEGTLTLHGPFYQPGDLTLRVAGGDRTLTFTEAAVAHEALYFEAAEAARCIAEGAIQSGLRPPGDSITTLRVVDEIRRRCGIVFAEEDGVRPSRARRTG
jgi:hypothetical protein